jgi:RimJ/RimL family protein N-acetyltransferase
MDRASTAGQSVSGERFLFRRMRPEDKPAVLEIASRIWEGTDYLPVVFDEWVADAEGEFAAVLLDGRVIGCGKLTFLTPTDAWLEGVRKDPRAAERGVGRAVSEYLLSRLARRPDVTSIRFATYVKNRASIVTHERLGFRVRTTLSVKAWEGSRVDLLARTAAEAGAGSAGEEVRIVRDERAIMQYLRRRKYFEAAGGVMAEGWRAFPYSEHDFLDRYVSTGACRAVFGPSGIRGLSAWKAGRPGRTTVNLVCVDADDDEAALALIANAFQGAVENARQDRPGSAACQVEWMVPPGERFRRWCQAASLASWEQEDDFLVFEYPPENLRQLRAGTGG